MKKRLALITTYFPPANGVAVNRMRAFATYLGDDFDVEVFTIGKGTVETEKYRVYGAQTPDFFEKIAHVQQDSKLKHHLKTVLNIFLLKTGLTQNKFWRKRINQTLQARHREQPFDVVISSFAPIETHELAYQMKKSDPSLIWVADMRDEMSKNPFAINFVKKGLRKKELLFQNHIDLLTTVSKPILDDFKVLMPEVDNFLEIRNGFDHDIEAISPDNDVFTMLYAGTFYGDNKPTDFLKMLASLVENGDIDKFRIQFLGTSRNFKVPQSLDQFVEFVPKVSYLEAVEYMNNADCNLLFCVPTSKGRFTGKVFDYLSVETPILALLDTEDVASELIVEVNGGLVGEFYDQDKAKRNLLEIYQMWVEKKKLNVDREVIQGLHRRNQVRKLADEVQKLLSS